MGQRLAALDSRVSAEILSSELKSSCGVLTGCTGQTGSLVEIRRLYERYRKHSQAKGHHLSRSDFHMVLRNSPVEGLTDAYSGFERSGLVNMLEFIAALVLYAATSWESKVLFLIELFDFDGNRSLSKDELTILCTAVLNGFGSLTASPRMRPSQLAGLSEEVFTEADSTPDGLITYDE